MSTPEMFVIFGFLVAIIIIWLIWLLLLSHVFHKNYPKQFFFNIEGKEIKANGIVAATLEEAVKIFEEDFNDEAILVLKFSEPKRMRAWKKKQREHRRR